MSKLSVALATYNESLNIKRCLEALEGFADEVVIVDGESTDNTVETAKRYSARVILKPNNKNFHINKQAAIDACKFEWILQLDADEVVSSPLKKEIQKVMSLNGIYNGYWMPRKNWFLGRFLMKGGQYPDYTLRLYRNGKGRLPQKDVHEQAVVEGEVGYLYEALYHYPYKDFAAYIAKWNRYNIFASDQIAQEQKKADVVGKVWLFISFMLLKPAWWFLWTYIRHKGFMDLWPGFVFSLFSALRFPVSYIVYLRSKI